MSFCNDFKFCPSCGGAEIRYLDRRKWRCGSCGFELYHNVAAAVCAVIADGEGNVLFETRAKEPRRGFLALPGGFCDPDESAENAVVRECSEEIGFAPEHIEYICSFPNIYEYRNILYKTCDLFFAAGLPAGCASVRELIERLHPQQSEVAGICARRVCSEEDIRNLPLAFDSARKTLTVWLSHRRIE